MTTERPTDRPATEKITFIGSSGNELTGVLHRPPQIAKASVLMAHCFTCSKDLHTMTRLANALSDAGFAAFRFDFTGLGESEGDFSKKTLSGNVTDIVRAATTLIEMGFGPYGAIGHSLGGAAVLLAAEKLKTVRSFVTIATPAEAAHVRHLLGDTEAELLANGQADVTIGGRTFTLEDEFLHDILTHDVLEAVANLDRPYMTVHAEDDMTVLMSDAERLHDAAPQLKKFVRLSAGGHLFGDRDAAEEMAKEITAWFSSTI